MNKKVDVRVLSGHKLDAMVTIALGKKVQVQTTDMIVADLHPERDKDLIEDYRERNVTRLKVLTEDGKHHGYVQPYSSSWSVGGQIFEREISNHERRADYFYCNKFAKPNSRWPAGTAIWAYGDTLLEAAMRVIVMHHLGELVELPEGL